MTFSVMCGCGRRSMHPTALQCDECRTPKPKDVAPEPPSPPITAFGEFVELPDRVVRKLTVVSWRRIGAELLVLVTSHGEGGVAVWNRYNDPDGTLYAAMKEAMK